MIDNGQLGYTEKQVLYREDKEDSLRYFWREVTPANLQFRTSLLQWKECTVSQTEDTQQWEEKQG